MSNQSFNQFAAQNPANQFAPQPQTGFAPQGAPTFGPPPSPAPAPAPGYGPPQGPPPGYGPPTAPQPGYGPAPAPYGAPGMPAPTGYAPQAPAGAQQSAPLAFGAGAFAGAAPVSDKKECQPGDYLADITATEQIRDRKNVPMWKLSWTIAHVYQGAQPVGSECNTVQQMGDADQIKYAGAYMLEVAQAAFGCMSDHELRQGLAARAPQSSNAWADFADALQVKGQQVNASFGPNPLAGARIRILVTQEPGQGKHQGKIFTRIKPLPAPRT